VVGKVQSSWGHGLHNIVLICARLGVGISGTECCSLVGFLVCELGNSVCESGVLVCELRNSVCELGPLVCELRNSVCELGLLVCELRNSVCELGLLVRDLEKYVCELHSWFVTCGNAACECECELCFWFVPCGILFVSWLS
jgi:hypothetical protein